VAIPGSYIVITVPRARRVHQSFWTAPFRTVKCFWAGLNILRGVHVEQRSRPKTMIPRYPDLILTNGPATGVCIVLAAKLIRLLRYVSTSLTVWYPAVLSLYEGQAPTPYPLRTVFIESWARVTSLSLSGKILLPFVDRFLVQWPSLRGKRAWRGMKESEFVGTLVE
jgi:beta-1,4-N-acetylglucosaminyltransferase